jgi:leucyl aminopeptidase
VDVEATTSRPLETAADTIVIGLFEGEEIAHDLPGEPLAGLRRSGEARSEPKRLAVLHAEGRRFITVGLGSRDQFDPERARVAAACALARAQELGAASLCWELPHHVGDQVAAAVVEGTLLRTYRFDRYKPRESGHDVELLIVSAHHDIAAPVRRAATVTAAQNRARDLGNAPANELTPAALAEYARELAERHGTVSATVLEEHEIRNAGMGAFAAVAQGSASDARLIRLDYDGSPGGGPDGSPARAAPLLALVGKGITFDSGGLSLKPPPSMIEMKFDMSGGAAVIEAVGALAELDAPVRVCAVVGATENLPSGTAVKPGDIVRALDGTTIEVNNTDAEGRLVLADCLCYARREGCDLIVDLATLTPIDAVLGSTYAAIMSNDDDWAARVMDCGERSGELLWRLPIHEDYAEMVKGRYAQLTNRTERREAMPLTAAEFLHHFAGDTPWAHLDIVGTAYDVPRPYFVGKGATGFGVRLLVELAQGLEG